MQTDYSQPLPCPRCRKPLPLGLQGRCPGCNANLARYRGASRRSATQGPTPFGHFLWRDRGLWSLLAVNLATLAIAVFDNWELGYAMLLYWGQSVLIGVGFIIRMLSLQRFSTDGFKINNRPVEAVPATRTKVALFFACHYGFFHFVYLLFLGIQHSEQALSMTLLLCLAAFAAQQWLSVRDDVDEDREREPNIGTLMTLPYARIVPMHLMIILGGLIAESVLGMLLFMLLKVAADLCMYLVELYALYPKRRRSAARSEPVPRS